MVLHASQVISPVGNQETKIEEPWVRELRGWEEGKLGGGDCSGVAGLGDNQEPRGDMGSKSTTPVFTSS